MPDGDFVSNRAAIVGALAFIIYLILKSLNVNELIIVWFLILSVILIIYADHMQTKSNTGSIKRIPIDSPKKFGKNKFETPRYSSIIDSDSDSDDTLLIYVDDVIDSRDNSDIGYKSSFTRRRENRQRRKLNQKKFSTIKSRY